MMRHPQSSSIVISIEQDPEHAKVVQRSSIRQFGQDVTIHKAHGISPGILTCPGC